MDENTSFEDDYDLDDESGLVTSGYNAEEGDTDGWLISYADMMTLIACFFILMMVFATFEKRKYLEISKQVSEYFGVNVGAQSDKTDGLMTNLPGVINEDIDLKNAVSFSKNAQNEMELTLKDKYFFRSGSASLKARSERILNKLIDKIYAESSELSVVVEGHTDDVPISKTGKVKEYFHSNWELSAARSSMVARKFNEKGFHKSKIRAIGFADSKPLFPNRDELGKPIRKNRSQNRRVVIRLAEPPPEGYKMGFGLLYRKDDIRKSRVKSEKKK